MSSPVRERARAEAPDVHAPPPRHPIFPHAEGVRGLAAIAVLIVHSWLFSGGFGGTLDTLPNRAAIRLDSMVVVFFLLSAFLLYRPMIAHRSGGPAAPPVSDFARRRFLRIYPPYWVALTGLALFPGLVGVFSGDWWAFYSLADYLDPHVDSPACADEGYNCGLLQSWSLTVEVSFYLMLPLFAALTGLLARNARRWLRAELIVLAAAGALTLALGAGPLNLRDEAWFQFSLLGHLDWLGLGMAMAALSVVYGRRERDVPRLLAMIGSRPGACWIAAFAVYVVTIFALPPVPFTVAPLTPAQFIGIHLAQCAIAGLVLAPVAFGNPNLGLPRRILATPWLAWVGLVSYGLYLYQVTIGIHLGFGGAHSGFATVLVGTVLLSVPLAAISFYFIERPLMRFRPRPLGELLRRRSLPASSRDGESR